jgi:hypothetical protein
MTDIKIGKKEKIKEGESFVKFFLFNILYTKKTRDIVDDFRKKADIGGGLDFSEEYKNLLNIEDVDSIFDIFKKAVDGDSFLKKISNILSKSTSLFNGVLNDFYIYNNKDFQQELLFVASFKNYEVNVEGLIKKYDCKGDIVLKHAHEEVKDMAFRYSDMYEESTNDKVLNKDQLNSLYLYPLSIRFLPSVSEKELVEFINNNYPKIVQISKQYVKNKSKYSKKKINNLELIKRRVIWENFNLSASEIDKMLAQNRIENQSGTSLINKIKNEMLSTIKNGTFFE